jgi:hypothetical protein
MANIFPIGKNLFPSALSVLNETDNKQLYRSTGLLKKEVYTSRNLFYKNS